MTAMTAIVTLFLTFSCEHSSCSHPVHLNDGDKTCIVFENCTTRTYLSIETLKLSFFRHPVCNIFLNLYHHSFIYLHVNGHLLGVFFQQSSFHHSCDTVSNEERLHSFKLDLK